MIGENHIVVGAGVSGCVTAILKKRAGYDVTIIERNQSKHEGLLPLGMETCNIVSENHSGAEYPYDAQSARDCFDGRIENQKFFPEFIYGGKTFSRVIASQSMIDEGENIAQQCRQNMEVIRNQYKKRVGEDFGNFMFGSFDNVCREIDSLDGVDDVHSVFITPQRGFNTVYVSLVLEHELLRLGIPVIQGANVTDIKERSDGYTVNFTQGEVDHQLSADQISICAAAYGFKLAKKINPDLELPEIYLALREIIYTDLPEGTEKNFTCLKLEDKYGGMLSPLSKGCALVYHPPSAHIDWQKLDLNTGSYPVDYVRFLNSSHPEFEERAETSLNQVKRFYPELRKSSVISKHLKVAINVTHDSRQRRNMGVFSVKPGCNMLVLPKWTMSVVDAKKDLVLAINNSIAKGTISEVTAKEIFESMVDIKISVPDDWYKDRSSYWGIAKMHADNMGVPEQIADGLLGNVI